MPPRLELLARLLPELPGTVETRLFVCIVANGRIEVQQVRLCALACGWHHTTIDTADM